MFIDGEWHTVSDRPSPNARGTVKNPHPDYLAAPEARRWGQSLDELFGVLRAEAWKLKGTWAWRVLPHGALVSVRIVPPSEGLAFHTELRLARKDAPKDSTGWQKWNQEIAVFLKHLGGGAGDWQETKNYRDEGKADVRLRFRMRGEEAEPKCARCGETPVIQPGLFREDLCRKCAIAAGNADIRAKQAARGELAESGDATRAHAGPASEPRG